MENKLDEKHLTSDTSTAGVPAVEYGQVIDYPAETGMGNSRNLRRTFKARHIQMICLGGCIGSGIFISTGKVNCYLSVYETGKYI
jgi:amino acid transporter